LQVSGHLPIRVISLEEEDAFCLNSFCTQYQKQVPTATEAEARHKFENKLKLFKMNLDKMERCFKDIVFKVKIPNGD